MTRLTITLCGSLTRAPEHLIRVQRALALAGHAPFAPVPPLPGELPLTAEQLAHLDAGHRHAIRRSDLVIGIAPDGRPGKSTGNEMAYAADHGIPTRWVLSDNDLTGLFDNITHGRLTPVGVPA